MKFLVQKHMFFDDPSYEVSYGDEVFYGYGHLNKYSANPRSFDSDGFNEEGFLNLVYVAALVISLVVWVFVNLELDYTLLFVLAAIRLHGGDMIASRYGRFAMLHCLASLVISLCDHMVTVMGSDLVVSKFGFSVYPCAPCFFAVLVLALQFGYHQAPREGSFAIFPGISSDLF
ncbi:hypothetical protein MTR67_030584 [Solanum verrucosum]|uniref:Uncharacterized protein n=1 Tax=Solanum verrucosum TaxID=315347 RepID=A0AAF0R697_SOLVR|nr:hypothetical protein MTR67_030584 [Solanum verrucosum]